MIYFVDCPLGYFGYNCSQKCSPPQYGKFCTQICEQGCRECHYREGCTLRNQTMGNLSKDIINIYLFIYSFIYLFSYLGIF